LVSIFIVEDHNIVRDGIKSIIEKDPLFKVVGEAKSDEEAIKKLSQDVKAEIVLTGLNHTESSNINFIEQLKANSCDSKVILLSLTEDGKYINKAFSLGARGYLLKTVSQDEMIFAIRHIAAGERYICAELSLKLLDQLNKNVQSIKLEVELSKRELEVLALIAEGMTNNEIANKLFTSRRTIEGHRQNLLDKTNTRNTAALIRFSVKNGLVQ
jgi:DNA-binding NarL/FixJ family response regulator